MKDTIRKASVGAVVAASSLAGLSPLAHADTIPADPTGGAMASSQTTIQTWVITYGVPVLFGLTLLGVLIRIGRKWFKRAASSV